MNTFEELDRVLDILVNQIKCSSVHCPYYRKNKCTPPKTSSSVCKENILYFVKKEVEKNEQRY